MATTAQTALPAIPFFDDRVIRISASGLSTANAGDWIAEEGVIRIGHRQPEDLPGYYLKCRRSNGKWDHRELTKKPGARRRVT